MTKAASVHTIASPTVAELVDRARELGPLLRKNAAASEANRRVEEETIQAMKKAGLMRVCTPKRYGGWEMNTRAMLDVSSAIAEGDAPPPGSPISITSAAGSPACFLARRKTRFSAQIPIPACPAYLTRPRR